VRCSGTCGNVPPSIPLRLNESAVRAEIAEVIAADEALTSITADDVADANIHAECCAVVERTDLSEESSAAVLLRSPRSAGRSGDALRRPDLSPSLEPAIASGLFRFQSISMTIPECARTNFDALLRAAGHGEPRYVICAMGRRSLRDYALRSPCAGQSPMRPTGHSGLPRIPANRRRGQVINRFSGDGSGLIPGFRGPAKGRVNCSAVSVPRLSKFQIPNFHKMTATSASLAR
jgi:hypothetical protein